MIAGKLGSVGITRVVSIGLPNRWRFQCAGRRLNNEDVNERMIATGGGGFTVE